MARVTVEDCIKVVENRFELVNIASQRARAISSGATLTVDRRNDKDAVIALREIAAGTVSVPAVKEILINNLQRRSKIDKVELDVEADLNEEAIEAELSDYQFENMGDLDDMGDDMSFEADNFDIDD